MIVGFQGGSTPNPRNHPHRGGGCRPVPYIYIYILYIFIYLQLYIYNMLILPRKSPHEMGEFCVTWISKGHLLNGLAKGFRLLLPVGHPWRPRPDH